MVRRWGDVERYPHCLSAYWAGAYAVASWAAHALRLPRLPADAVVLRTRPDGVNLVRKQATLGYPNRARHTYPSRAHTYA